MFRLQLLEPRRLGWHAAFGHFQPGGPDDGVKHHLAEVVVAPVPVDVGAGEAETPPAAGPLVDPGHVLRHPFAGEDRGVRAVGVTAGPMHFVGRDGREDRRDALHVVRKTHVKVPLVATANGLTPRATG